MSLEMVKLADEIRARFSVLESVPGSGYHDNDKNPTKNDIFMAPQKKGFCRASENIVPFVGEYEVVFVGEDAHKALGILHKHQEKLSSQEALTPQQMKIRKAIKNLKINDVRGVSRLMLRRPIWNDYIEIFYANGQGISCLPFTEEE